MRIRVLFFGVLRDIVGLREDSVEVPDGSRLESVFEHYAGKFPRLREMSANLVLALNQSFSEPSASLSEDDEVAFLPPVSGGSSEFVQQIEDPAGHFFAITRGPIDSMGLAHRLQRGEDGAVVTFEADALPGVGDAIVVRFALRDRQRDQLRGCLAKIFGGCGSFIDVNA